MFNMSFLSIIQCIFLNAISFTFYFKIPSYYVGELVKLATVIDGDPKAPFSIATTPRWRRGHYSFPRIDSNLIMLNVKLRGIKYHFYVFSMTRHGIEPRSPGPLANTLNHHTYRAIGLIGTLPIANSPGDRVSIPGQVIPKHHKVQIKVKVEQSREWSSGLLYTSV